MRDEDKNSCTYYEICGLFYSLHWSATILLRMRIQNMDSIRIAHKEIRGHKAVHSHDALQLSAQAVTADLPLSVFKHTTFLLLPP